MERQILTLKGKKILKTIGTIILTAFILIAIVVGGYLIVSGIMRADQSAKINLTDGYYLKARLDLKDFPGQALGLRLHDQNDNFLGSQNIDEIIGGHPIKYVESRNDSWKQVKLIKDENGTKVFEAIWGKIIIDEKKSIIIEWEENQ